jgi:hypothetical protein
VVAGLLVILCSRPVDDHARNRSSNMIANPLIA